MFEAIVNLYSFENVILNNLKKACFKSELFKIKYTMTACFTELLNRSELQVKPGQKLYRGVGFVNDNN